MFHIVSFKLEWGKNARKVQLEQFLGTFCAALFCIIFK